MMHPLLDPDKQKKAKKYEREKRRFGLISSVVSVLYLAGFYFSGMSAFVVRVLSDFNTFFSVMFYSFVFITGSVLVAIPVSYLSGFHHEHQWGFSTQTLRHWVTDQVKGWLISLVLGSLVLYLLLTIIDRFPGTWWLIASLAVALVSVIFSTLLPVLILPLFNKYTPIEDEKLTSRLNKILGRNGLRASGFFRQNMSIRTKKENAFLAGLGKTRRVVLADTLLENMNEDEIESVIAHEVGHYRFMHMTKNILITTIQHIIIFWGLNILLGFIFLRFPYHFQYNLTILPVFILGLSLLSFLFSPLNLWISRSFEVQADRFALAETGNGDAFIRAIAGLTNRNLGNAYPEKWIKVLYYSHPPAGERIEAAEIL